MSEIINDAAKTIVIPDCDIVASTADALKKELKLAIDDAPESLTIDLSKVVMIDSMGLGVLIAAHNSLKKNDQKLRIIKASKDILSLLRNMRLHQHFMICED